MMYWYGHGMSGWGFAWMSLGMIAFWVLVIGGVVIGVRYALLDRTSPMDGSTYTPLAPQPTPEELLAQRFARGEIDEQEYTTRLAALRAH